MTLNKPYPQIFRHGPDSVVAPFYESCNTELGINYLASYEILKNDLKKIFEYIEPNEKNLDTYSHRTFELLIRSCMEVESLCKLVFAKNEVTLVRNANIIRFSDLEGPMKLSEYELKSYGFNLIKFKPFVSFSNPNRKQRNPSWYKAYNEVKHNRAEKFNRASLINVIHAIGAVYVLLIAQFGFGFDHKLIFSWHGVNQKIIPSLFSTSQLPEWLDTEKYEYNWIDLKKTGKPYQYHSIPIIP